jgi:lantibiotic modifying enzyme
MVNVKELEEIYLNSLSVVERYTDINDGRLLSSDSTATKTSTNNCENLFDKLARNDINVEGVIKQLHTSREINFDITPWIKFVADLCSKSDDGAITAFDDFISSILLHASKHFEQLAVDHSDLVHRELIFSLQGKVREKIFADYSKLSLQSYAESVFVLLKSGLQHQWTLKDWFIKCADVARNIICYIFTVVDCVALALSRFHMDGLGLHTVKISRVQLLSDFSEGKVGTSIFHLTDGAAIVYKDRPVSVDVGYFKFLEALNRFAFELPVPVISIAPRGNYSWSKFLTWSDLIEERHMVHLGELMALHYMLGSQDIIADNIIFTADGPVIIDAETIINASVDPDEDCQQTGDLYELARIGFLPVWSLLKGRFAERSVLRKVFEHNNRLGLHTPNEPLLEALGRSFQKTLKKLIDNQAVIVTLLKKYFNNVSLRYLNRDTITYRKAIDSLLSKSAGTPLKLTNQLQTLIAIDRHTESSKKRLIKFEFSAITRNQIPKFYHLAQERNLFYKNFVIENFFSSSALEQTTQRVEAMSTDAIASLTKQIYVGFTDTVKLTSTLSDNEKIDAATIMPFVRQIRDVVFSRINKRHTQDLKKEEVGAYHGLLGKIAFLSSYVACEEDVTIRCVLVTLLKRHLWMFEHLTEAELQVHPNIGLDLYIVIYALRRLDEGGLIADTTPFAVKVAKAALKNSSKLDIIGGLAGTCIALHALLRHSWNSELSSILHELCRHLRNHAEDSPSNPGLAHGFPGRQFALIRTDTPGTKPDQIVEGLFDVYKNAEAFTSTESGAKSWCSGLLDYFILLVELNEKNNGQNFHRKIIENIDCFQQISANMNDNLCCGRSGIIDFTLSLETIYPSVRKDVVNPIIKEMLNRAKKNNKYFLPNNDLSLYQGLAGTGHSLLRAVATENVPSLTLFNT